MPKINSTYDVGAAFEAIENQLMASMIRNMKRHKVWEVSEDMEWTMWQTEQLHALEKYRKENQKKFGRQFRNINAQIEALLQIANAYGQMSQEAAILRAIKNGFPARRVGRGATAEFFRLNERKLNALIGATMNDMQRAEVAVLRMANDQYRKVIFNAQMYANTGAATYEKAVDMATKDFAAAGLNCVQYSNGARHTLADYADMAIRTAAKRAYLQGEGAKRQEWGIHTVIVNKRSDRGPGGVCPQCLPFVGKVFIDDVWSGGKKSDGPYPLISTAIEAGLYHPRCKDSHTTYFPGVSAPPDDSFTKKELQQVEEAEKESVKQQNAQLQAEKWQRVADTRLDPENRQAARQKADEWKEKTAPFTPAKTVEEAQKYAQQFCETQLMDRTFKGVVDFKGVSVEHANAINRSLTDVFGRFPDLEKLSGIKAVDPASRLGKKAFKDGADALFSYDPIQHGIYINKAVLKDPKTLDAYMERSKEAWDLVMNNMDKLSGRQRDLVERYAKAGRDLVSGDTVEGLFTHELGHHVQWTMLDPKTTNAITEKMQTYAPHLSGYATSSKSEYLAESFAAYMKGEIDLLDPEYVEFLDKKISKSVTKSVSNDTIKIIEAVSSKELHNAGNAVILKEKIASGEITLTVNAEKQADHLVATRSSGKSYLTISLEEIQQIVKERYGTGTVIISKSGQIKEILDCEKDIGIVIDPQVPGDKGVLTDRITIHYSKKRTHVVPAKRWRDE